MRRLPRAFFARPVLEVAADLLGRHVRHGGVTLRITETEAYAGLVDPASRVLSRPTRHKAPVFGPPGHAIVYFTYGHHWMLCVVTGDVGVPDVVLLRAGGGRGRSRLRVREAPGCVQEGLVPRPGSADERLGVSGSLSGADVCASGSEPVLEPGEADPGACRAHRATGGCQRSRRERDGLPPAVLARR